MLRLPLACIVAALAVTSCARQEKPNVILISIDTLRADRLGCYGYGKQISPNLDALAAQAAVFENSFSSSNYTLPSHASMLTSLATYSHRLTQTMNVLPETVSTLAEVLQGDGYATGGFTGNTWVSGIFGFNRGFETWVEKRYIKELLPGVKDWVRKNRTRPFFLFYHFYDVHTPYTFRKRYRGLYREPSYAKEIRKYDGTPEGEREKKFPADRLPWLSMGASLTVKPTLMHFSPAGEDEQVEEAAARFGYFRDSVEKKAGDWKKSAGFPSELGFIVDSYDAGVLYTDSMLGRLFDFLRENGAWDNTLVIVTSDHGEELMDHDLVAHFNYGYDTLIRVPLIMKFPAGRGPAPGRYAALAEGVDLMPTVMAMLGLSHEGPMQGKSLLNEKPGGTPGAGELIFATTGDLKKFVVRSPSFKYIARMGDDGGPLENYKFYDLTKDPGEKDNIIEKAEADPAYEPVVKDLKEALKEHLGDCDTIHAGLYPEGRKAGKMDDKHLDQLKALGYIQ